MFYCRKINGQGFSIKEWNEAFRHCIDNNLSEKETSGMLEGIPCKKQCFDCLADVGERQLKTKELIK